MVLPCLFNFIIVLTSSFIIGDDPDEHTAIVALGICVAVSGAATLVTLVLKERLLRVELEGGGGGAKNNDVDSHNETEQSPNNHPSHPYEDVTIVIASSSAQNKSRFDGDDNDASPKLLFSDSSNNRFREDNSRESASETAPIDRIVSGNTRAYNSNRNKINEDESDSDTAGSAHAYSDAALFGGGRGGSGIAGDDSNNNNAHERQRLLS